MAVMIVTITACLPSSQANSAKAGFRRRARTSSQAEEDGQTGDDLRQEAGARHRELPGRQIAAQRDDRRAEQHKRGAGDMVGAKCHSVNSSSWCRLRSTGGVAIAATLVAWAPSTSHLRIKNDCSASPACRSSSLLHRSACRRRPRILRSPARRDRPAPGRALASAVWKASLNARPVLMAPRKVRTIGCGVALRRENADPEIVFNVVAELLERRHVGQELSSASRRTRASGRSLPDLMCASVADTDCVVTCALLPRIDGDGRAAAIGRQMAQLQRARRLFRDRERQVGGAIEPARTEDQGASGFLRRRR